MPTRSNERELGQIQARLGAIEDMQERTAEESERYRALVRAEIKEIDDKVENGFRQIGEKFDAHMKVANEQRGAFKVLIWIAGVAGGIFSGLVVKIAPFLFEVLK